MFGPPGFTYIYLIYGMYFCLNIVSHLEGKTGAVLLRGLLLPGAHLNGPGKLCKHLGLTREHHGINTTQKDAPLYIAQGVEVKDCLMTPRIGIKKAIDKPWRFLLPPHHFIFS